MGKGFHEPQEVTHAPGCRNISMIDHMLYNASLLFIEKMSSEIHSISEVNTDFEPHFIIFYGINKVVEVSSISDLSPHFVETASRSLNRLNADTIDALNHWNHANCRYI